MTKSNKQKSLFKRILCVCLSILLLPYHWLYAWFLWTERQREQEEAESSSNHSSLYDNDIFSEKTSRKAGHDLYDPNDLLVTIKDVAWTKRLKWTKAVLKFLESLNYYELSIVNDDNNATEYFADDYTKQFPNDGYLRSDVEFRVA